MEDPQSQKPAPSKPRHPWRGGGDSPLKPALVTVAALTLIAGGVLLMMRSQAPAPPGPAEVPTASVSPAAPAAAPPVRPTPPAPVAPPAPAAQPTPEPTPTPAPAAAPPTPEPPTPEPKRPATHEVFNTHGDQDAPWLMLRREPSPRAEEVYAMQDGTALRILTTGHGPKQSWWHVRVMTGEGEGTTGYAHSRWIRPRTRVAPSDGP